MSLYTLLKYGPMDWVGGLENYATLYGTVEYLWLVFTYAGGGYKVHYFIRLIKMNYSSRNLDFMSIKNNI